MQRRQQFRWHRRRCRRRQRLGSRRRRRPSRSRARLGRARRAVVAARGRRLAERRPDAEAVGLRAGVRPVRRPALGRVQLRRPRARARVSPAARPGGLRGDGHGRDLLRPRRVPERPPRPDHPQHRRGVLVRPRREPRRLARALPGAAAGVLAAPTGTEPARVRTRSLHRRRRLQPGRPRRRPNTSAWWGRRWRTWSPAQRTRGSPAQSPGPGPERRAPRHSSRRCPAAPACCYPST